MAIIHYYFGQHFILPTAIMFMIYVYVCVCVCQRRGVKELGTLCLPNRA